MFKSTRTPPNVRRRIRLACVVAASVSLCLAGCGESSNPDQTLAPQTTQEAAPKAPVTQETAPETPEASETPATAPDGPDGPLAPEVPEAAWRTVSDLIDTATGAAAVRRGAPQVPFTIGTEMSHYTSTTQTFAGPRYTVALPWRDDDGDLNFTFSALSPTPPEGLAPVSLHGRFVDTADDTRIEVVQHDLEDGWSVRSWATGTSNSRLNSVASPPFPNRPGWIPRRGCGR